MERKTLRKGNGFDMWVPRLLNLREALLATRLITSAPQPVRARDQNRT
jgi:hypothetical protein